MSTVDESHMGGKDTLNKLLREPMAALRGAQILAYLNDMSRILRSVRLALDSLATLVQSIPKGCKAHEYVFTRANVLYNNNALGYLALANRRFQYLMGSLYGV